MHAHFVVAGAGLCHKFLHITELFSFPCIQKYIAGFFSTFLHNVNRELYASSLCRLIGLLYSVLRAMGKYFTTTIALE